MMTKSDTAILIAREKQVGKGPIDGTTGVGDGGEEKKCLGRL